MSDHDLRPHAYVLAVHDLAGSAGYFRDVLGFTPDWGDGHDWQALKRGAIRVHLGRCDDALAPAALGDHSYFGFFSTAAVDELYAEFLQKGAIVLSGPTDKPWGWREMAVATPEGHRMMFAEPLQETP